MLDEREIYLRRRQRIRKAGFSSDFDPGGLRKEDKREEVGEIRKLFSELGKAIGSEEYLEAAKLRDSIYDLRESI